MSNNDSVVNALLQAVDATPEDAGLRLHLAKLLLEGDRAAEALEHYATVLNSDPINIAALKGARDAARRVGDLKRSEAYATLLGGLAPQKTEVDKGADDRAAAAGQSDVSRAAGRPELRVVGGTADPEKEDADAEGRITLADVAGLDDVKKRIELAFLGPLRNPGMAKAYGKKLRGGLLLYGPPGCGKTYIARALAGELQAGFLSIGLSDVLNMYIGESEQRLHALFERARHNAPTVIFMDELDALGRKRSELRHSGTREVVNQLLQELDGVNTGNEPVFVLGATNLPWDIDVALKRPGRFDRAIFVEPPDLVAREHILTLNLDGRPVEGADLKGLAKKTRGYSGADLAFICETATESALERAMQSGSMAPITDKDLRAAFKEVRPSIANWFESARNYAMFANASGEFNDLADYIRKHRI